jgi:hypothetical protein
MPPLDTDDRREYYRIGDTIALEFHLLSGAEAQATEALHDASPLFNLLSDLHLADFESQQLLRHIGERDRSLASYLKVINKRIDLLGQALAQNLLRDVGSPKQVSMSEGGIGFDNPREIPVGSQLAIKMVLMPQALGLLLRAEVVHCQEKADGQFEIGTEFEGLTEAQRQLLARHILQKQALDRRQALQRPSGDA